MEESDFRRIQEISYLNQDNTWRYRAIVHFCYQRHAHMQTYVYPEDIFHFLREDAHFAEYSFDQLEQDLSQLVAWGNLKPHQETGRARSIVDFKRRRFRYQCTPYTVEIERMVEKLKSLGDEFGGSLETTQFDRILSALKGFLTGGEHLENAELNQIWEDLQHYFHTLVQNASDYLAHLKSAKVEERMQTSAFIVYKDKFTQYLQNFILGLQRASVRIEKLFKESEPEREAVLFERLAVYQSGIPRLGVDKSEDAYQQDYRESFQVMREWFLGTEYRESELQLLSQETMETIRRITRFAQRLAEQHQAFRSRKTDYLYLAKWFAGLGSKHEADTLAGVLFGPEGVRHFYAEPRGSDNMDGCIFEELPTEIEVKPRVSTYREKMRTSAVRDHREEKEQALRIYREQQRKLNETLNSLIDGDVIDFEKLPVVTKEVRRTLLTWMTRCMQQRGSIRTETGREISLQWDRRAKRSVCLRSEDGEFYLPPVKLKVKQAGR